MNCMAFLESNFQDLVWVSGLYIPRSRCLLFSFFWSSSHCFSGPSAKYENYLIGDSARSKFIFPFASPSPHGFSLYLGTVIRLIRARRSSTYLSLHILPCAQSGISAAELYRNPHFDALRRPRPACSYNLQRTFDLIDHRQIFPWVKLILRETMVDMQPKTQTRPHSSRHVQGQNMVFRIPNYKKNSLACGSEPSEQIYHSRRSHRKSRAGCVNCKQRRVKVLPAPPLSTIGC